MCTLAFAIVFLYRRRALYSECPFFNKLLRTRCFVPTHVRTGHVTPVFVLRLRGLWCYRAFLPGATKIWFVGVVHPVRIQRRRPKRLRHFLGKTSLLWIGVLADRAVHGEPSFNSAPRLVRLTRVPEFTEKISVALRPS